MENSGFATGVRSVVGPANPAPVTKRYKLIIRENNRAERLVDEKRVNGTILSMEVGNMQSQRTKVTRRMNEFAQALGAKIKRHDWGLELQYDAHGAVSFDSEEEFLEVMSAYKGGHPDYESALADYKL